MCAHVRDNEGPNYGNGKFKFRRCLEGEKDQYLLIDQFGE